MFNKVPIKGKKTICLVSGGNIDVTILNRVINRGLEKAAVYAQYQWSLTTNPDSSMRSTALSQAWAAMCLAYIMSAAHTARKINACELSVKIETRNHEHVEEIKESLKSKGFKLK